MARYSEDCTPRQRSKETNNMTYFCKSSDCITWKQQTDMKNQGRKTKQLRYTKLGYRAS